MSFRTSAVLLALCSLGLGLFLLVLVRFFLPALPSEGYGVLAVDAAYGDREIGALLARGGLEDFVSESTQWVFLDDFEGLRRIPLDRYGEQIEPFDPRNDGYAEKLRSFFVRGGERFFFIPLSPDFVELRRETLTGQIARSLGDIPYSLVIMGGGSKPVFWFFVLFAAAAAGTLIFSGMPLLCAALLPVLAPLLFAGPPGFALSAVLTGLSAILRGPVRDYVISRRYRYLRFLPEPSRRRVFRDWLGIFRGQGLLAPVFILAYGTICGMGGIPPILGLFFFCSVGVVFFLFIRAESSRGESPEHIRFVPVAILDFSVNREFFPRTLFPFGLASLLSLFLFPLFSGSSGPPSPEFGPFPLVSSADYENHTRFQRSFSVTPLGDRGGDGYTRYVQGEDGLIAPVPADPGGNPGEAVEGIPPFPLESLMAFLEGGGGAGEEYSPPWDILPVCLVLLAGTPLLVSSGQGNRKKKKILVYQDKRIAA